MVKVCSSFFSGKISRSFIYPSLNNSEQKFKKIYLFQNDRVPSHLKLMPDLVIDDTGVEI